MKQIIFFGNSLTAGYGLYHPESQSFPALIANKIRQENLAYQVHNAGVSGDTTTSGLLRINAVLQQPTAIFVLELGANDMLRGIHPEVTARQLQQMVNLVRAKHPDAKLLLLGMQLPDWVPGPGAAAFRKVYKDLAQNNNMAFLPFILEGVAGIKELNMADGIHPLAEGYEIIADKVWQVLKPLLVRQ